MNGKIKKGQPKINKYCNVALKKVIKWQKLKNQKKQGIKKIIQQKK